MLRTLIPISVFALAACAEQGDEGMYVLNNTAPTGDSCFLNGSTMQPFVAHGEIWVGSNRGYLLTPLIQSRYVSPTGVDPIQNTIQLRSANVELTLKALTVPRAGGGYDTTQPNSSVGTFSALFSGALPPGGSVNVGFDVIPVASLQDILGVAVTAEVLASVTIVGDVNGSEVVSSPFLFPISICSDCVVNILTDSLGQYMTCPVPTTVTPRAGNPCNVFQDGNVDCCVQPGTTTLVCPAPVGGS